LVGYSQLPCLTFTFDEGMDLRTTDYKTDILTTRLCIISNKCRSCQNSHNHRQLCSFVLWIRVRAQGRTSKLVSLFSTLSI